jgi:hypothetical protein
LEAWIFFKEQKGQVIRDQLYLSGRKKFEAEANTQEEVLRGVVVCKLS